MTTPTVSVVIPAFNHGRFIASALDSVLASGHEDLEVVLVDDGSTDDTIERLEPYRSDPRITIHSQENRGAHAALNRGLELARGELLFILNSDDEYLPDRIPRLVALLDADFGPVLAASWIEVIDAEGGSLGVKQGHRNMPPWPPASDGPLLSETGELHLALLEGNFVSTTSNVAFRRALLADHGLRFLPLRYTHDWDFILSACHAGGFTLVEEPLVRYRVHGDNTIREGQERAAGEMRFEAMWTVCRHARRACTLHAERGMDRAELERRLWGSLPRFGCDTLLGQLLALRGEDVAPPAAYDELLLPDHPFRVAAVETLAAAP